MLAEGFHDAKAESWQFGLTKSGGEQVAVLFALLDADGKPTGERITWFGYFTDRSQERTIESLRYCGWTGADLTDATGLGSETVSLEVKHETYEGKTRVKVEWVNRKGGGAVKLERAMDEKGIRLLAAKMKALTAKTRPAPRTLGAAQREVRERLDREPPPPPGDDDIPF